MQTSSKNGWGEHLLLAFALVAWAVATVHLMVLLWRFVPTQSALFAGMGATPPMGLRIAIAASNWMVRLLPFAVLASPFVLGGVAVAGGLIAWRLDLSTRAVLRAVVVVALAGLSVTVLASFGIVHSADVGLDRRLEQLR
ncbi:MAG: hypothetical protein ABW221_06730 [Vicinamibacteria bacterium]